MYDRALTTGRSVGINGTRARVVTQALAIGDKLPSATFKTFNNEGNMKEITSEQLFKGDHSVDPRLHA